ncbi:hypothetical protein P8452_36614 [Trifolium repens]|nr:hypothetical protein P8452_36614 [Trifolium repens]
MTIVVKPISTFNSTRSGCNLTEFDALNKKWIKSTLLLKMYYGKEQARAEFDMLRALIIDWVPFPDGNMPEAPPDF